LFALVGRVSSHHHNHNRAPIARTGVFQLADYDNLDPESRRVVDAVLAQYGLSPRPSAQRVTPTRNGRELDTFDDQLRRSPIWQNWMRQNVGTDPDGATRRNIKLSDAQRKQLQAHLQANGIRFAKNFEIDPSGNVNDDQRPGRKIAIGAAIGGLALTGLGAAGIGPLSGVLGGAGAAGSAGASAAGAGGTLASSSLPVGSLMGGPAAITSAGVSGGVAGASAAGAAGRGLFARLAGLASNRDALGSLGAAAAGASDAMASNRGAQIDAELAAEQRSQQRGRDYFDQVSARERDWRESATHAMDELLRAEFVGGNRPGAAAPDVSPYFKGGSVVGTPTDAERAAAAAMRDEAMKRLQAGHSLLPQVTHPGQYRIDRALTRGSKTERALGIAAIVPDMIDLIF
jgi:hypothetical protein